MTNSIKLKYCALHPPRINNGEPKDPSYLSMRTAEINIDDDYMAYGFAMLCDSLVLKISPSGERYVQAIPTGLKPIMTFQVAHYGSFEYEKSQEQEVSHD